MFIQTESTPNPATLKFLPGREVMADGGTVDFRDAGQAAAASPLAARLFEVPGVTFRGYENGTVFLHMKGACAGCPSSTATLKHGIQNLLRHFIPEVREVEQLA